MQETSSKRTMQCSDTRNTLPQPGNWVYHHSLWIWSHMIRFKIRIYFHLLLLNSLLVMKHQWLHPMYQYHNIGAALLTDIGLKLVSISTTLVFNTTKHSGIIILVFSGCSVCTINWLFS